MKKESCLICSLLAVDNFLQVSARAFGRGLRCKRRANKHIAINDVDIRILHCLSDPF